MKIRTFVPLLIVSALGLQLSLEMVAESIDDNIHDKQLQIVEANQRWLTLAATTEVHFKKQVQEWKNILLRAHDPEVYQKHLKQFTEQEDATSRTIHTLLNRANIGADTTRYLTEFKRRHLQLGKHYRSLMENHNLQDDFRSVDSLIRGEDRELDHLITQAIDSIKVDIAAQQSLFQRSEEEVENVIAGIEVFGNLAVILLLYLLLDRRILNPLLIATSFSKKIAGGDFQKPIDVLRNDEMGQLLKSLNTMQFNLNSTQHALLERVKELDGLYHVSQILRDFDSSIEEVLTAIVAVMPASWQYPEICCARIIYDDESYQTDNFQETPWKISSQLHIGSNRACSIEVYYLEERPLADSGPFFKEEQTLLDSIGQNLVENIEYREAIKQKQGMEIQLHQAQKLESVGQLAAGIAHEINTPTQFVSDNTQFLQEAYEDMERIFENCDQIRAAAAKGSVPAELLTQIETTVQEVDLDYLKEEIPKAIKQSQEGLDRISKIVRAMKEFSHPGSKEKMPTDINQAIKTTIDVSRNEWKYCAELITDLDPALPYVPILVDEFNQVVLNLIVNAAHAIDDVKRDSENLGEIRLTTRQSGEWVEVAVSDTGKGVPAAIQKRIFDPFFTTKEVGKGSGQGLAIAWSVITDKHGGKISVESEEDRGSTFTIRLPITEDAVSA